MLQNLAMVTGVTPLLRWLQRFRFDPQQLAADPDALPESLSATPSTSLVLGAGEITVPDAALLIAELATELRLMDASAPLGSAVEQEREKEMLFNLIQTCVLMKLLGAGTDSGRLRLSELGALLEDAWLLVVPVNGVRVSQLLAQLRFCLLQQVSNITNSPHYSTWFNHSSPCTATSLYHRPRGRPVTPASCWTTPSAPPPSPPQLAQARTISAAAAWPSWWSASSARAPASAHWGPIRLCARSWHRRWCALLHGTTPLMRSPSATCAAVCAHCARSVCCRSACR